MATEWNVGLAHRIYEALRAIGYERVRKSIGGVQIRAWAWKPALAIRDNHGNLAGAVQPEGSRAMSTWYEVEIRNDYGTWDPFVESIYETAATQHRTREEAEVGCHPQQESPAHRWRRDCGREVARREGHRSSRGAPMTEVEALTASVAAKQQGIDDLSMKLSDEREVLRTHSDYKALEVRLAEAQDRLSMLKVENACLRWVVETAIGGKR